MGDAITMADTEGPERALETAEVGGRGGGRRE